MDLKDKIINTLVPALKADYIRLEDENGISGFIVSRQFERVSSLDRQEMIEEALDTTSLTREERRQVLMIAGLTPEEYDTVGVHIRIHKIRKLAGGAIEVLLYGGLSDAEYVRRALNNQKGIQTTEPKRVAGANGVLMSFQAKGTEATPLTRERALRILKKDPYIDVMPNA